jgi:hypothetical protein
MKKLIVTIITMLSITNCENVSLNVLISNKLTNAPITHSAAPRSLQSKTSISRSGTFTRSIKNALTIGTISYACLASLLYYYGYRVSQLRWVHWKETVALAQLEREDNQILAAQLIDDMYLLYGNELPTDSLYDHLLYFKEQIQHELTYCTRLETISEKMQLLHITWLFPFHKKEITNVKHYIRRLLFLKSLLLVVEPENPESNQPSGNV